MKPVLIRFFQIIEGEELHTASEIGQGRIYAGIQHMPLAVFIGSKEHDGARKGSQQRRDNAAVQSSSEAFLTEDFDICRR